MITRWLTRRREHAALAWHNARRDPATHWTSPPGAVARARRRLNRWDALLDLWTANGTR